jgi:DNA-binding XRE family transcriptional regulator
MSITFGTKIKQLRKAHGYDQNLVTDHLGVTRQSISMYELNCINCTEDNQLKLAE